MKYWIGVASREHVIQGKTEGIAQVCHGKSVPLKRMQPGDWIIYYSPTENFGTKQPCRKFTAICQVHASEPYRVVISNDFIPWRRNVTFIAAQEVAIEQLIDKLCFIKNKSHWGFAFMRGFFEISASDYYIIATAMGIKSDE